MSRFWNPSVQAEVSQDSSSLFHSLEKHKYNDGLIRSFRDSKTKNLFANLDVSRVAQLDSDMLNEEIIKLMREQIEKITTVLGNQASLLLSSYRSEVDLFIRIILWWFTLRLNQPSPGDSLQNLRYRNEHKFNLPRLKSLLTLPNDFPTKYQRFFHLILQVFLPWTWYRLREYAIEERWSENEDTEHRWSVIEAMDRAYRLAFLANFLFFLFDGKYKSLTERILKMRLVPARNESIRAVSFDLINQQLLFEGFTEIILCILPLIDWSAFIRAITRWKLIFHELLVRYLPFKLIDESFQNLDSPTRKYKCVSCETDPAIMPFRALPCSHVYCYFCLKTNSMKPVPRCVLCDERISQVERFIL